MNHLIGCFLVIIFFCVACKTPNKSNQQTTEPKTQTSLQDDDSCVEDMIIITLKGKVSQKQIVHAFGKKYNMRWFSAFDSPLNEGIYYFSPDSVKLEKLIEIMKNEQFSSDARCITTKQLEEIH